jgi:hypothetical protein
MWPACQRAREQAPERGAGAVHRAASRWVWRRRGDDQVGRRYDAVMTPRALADLPPGDQYVVVTAASRRHMSPQDLAAQLQPGDVEALMPAVRGAYEHREQTAQRLRQHLGVDPESPDQRDSAVFACELLDRAAQLGVGYTE